MLLREASATTSSAGKRRSARMLSISRPTLPVAPTTATLKPIELSETANGANAAARQLLGEKP